MPKNFGIPVEEPRHDPNSFQFIDFLNLGVDLFGLEDQFQEWTTADRNYPIMFIRFQALWNRLPEVFAFIGVASRNLNDFPEYRERHSDWRDLKSHHRKKLNQIYRPLAQQVESHPELVIR